MKSKELKTGIFVSVIVIVLFLGINYLRGNGLFSKGHVFIATYENVEGLNPATPIYIKGFKAGSVMGIRYNRETELYNIRINVSGDFDIPEDSRTEIYSSDILGGKSIRILLGSSHVMAESGDTLEGCVQQDVISSLLQDIAPLGKKFDTLVEDLDEAVRNLNAMLDSKNRENVAELLRSVRNSASDLEKLMASIEKKSPEITGIITDVKDISGTLKISAAKLDSTLSDVRDITAGIRDSELEETIASIHSLAEKLQNPNASIGKIMTTDTLYNSINALVTDLDSLVNKIKENPKKNLKISVF